ncbi:collagen alpha-1(I) chain-like [Penaeus monodon]|uniref:collagen alpha-1(I) chain-like n=1 Tax=Penaeus monodon TaxID=6687 RepID=UPI0018A73C8E|nr:collagen alpha-1(I) chain-like [Penaeus monodon]
MKAKQPLKKQETELDEGAKPSDITEATERRRRQTHRIFTPKTRQILETETNQSAVGGASKGYLHELIPETERVKCEVGLSFHRSSTGTYGPLQAGRRGGQRGPTIKRGNDTTTPRASPHGPTTGPPAFPAERPPPQRGPHAKAVSSKMRELGGSTPFTQPVASPAPCWEKGGDWRPRVGFIVPSIHPTAPGPKPPPAPPPHTGARGMPIFSKNDLVRAYHQKPPRRGGPEDSCETRPFGLYEFSRRMPFGLRNGPDPFRASWTMFNPRPTGVSVFPRRFSSPAAT